MSLARRAVNLSSPSDIFARNGLMVQPVARTREASGILVILTECNYPSEHSVRSEHAISFVQCARRFIHQLVDLTLVDH